MFTEKWTKTRSQGILLFILKWGVLWFGGLTLLITLGQQYFFENKYLAANTLLFYAVLHMAGGIVFGVFLWVVLESSYRITKRR